MPFGKYRGMPIDRLPDDYWLWLEDLGENLRESLRSAVAVSEEKMSERAFFEKPLSSLSKRYRIFYEEGVEIVPREEKRDYEELRGVKDTRIYRHGQDVLAVSTENERLYQRLKRTIPGLKPRTPCVLLFPDYFLDIVATAIKAKRRRQVTERERGRLREISPYTRKEQFPSQKVGF